MQTKSLLLIDEICKEKGIEVKKLSFDWIRELRKNGKIRHIVRNAFDLNTAACFNILNDKYATYEVLKNSNLPVLKHYMIFNPNEEKRKEYSRDIKEQIKEIFEKIGENKVVVKANSSSEGKEVYLVNSEEEALKIIQDIFRKIFSKCKYMPI